MGRVKSAMKTSKSAIGKINPAYDLCSNNIEEIRDNSNGIFDLICNSFRFGYVQGMKATKAELKG